jgi:hypothetical protein
MELAPDMVFVVEGDNQQDHEVMFVETLRNFRKSSIISYKASVRNSPKHEYNFYETLDKVDVEAKKRALDFYPEEYQEYVYFDRDNVEAVLRCGGIYIEAEFAEPFNAVKYVMPS